MPIAPALPELAAALGRAGVAVLRAPPGAGKTTAVPLALIAAGVVRGRILMLEPRRVAARAAAERLAEGLGEAVGGRVGYRMRGEAVAGAAIEVVTEGVLTRMIQSDPELRGIGLVIFDEFHERALASDLGLALALEIRGALRPDLKLLVMSATLDVEAVSALLDGAPVVTAEGRAFPVETLWLDRPLASGAGRGPGLEEATAELTLRALGETEGGVLVFLPGQREIARTAARLAPALPPGVRLQPLHGGLTLAEQRAALAPAREGRKLVLATSIAETSLTIPDVRVVIDAGRARRARFDPASGMSRLVTERVTRAEAEQRRGRAGRVAPGRCYRLWTKGEEGALAAAAPPEILAADLAGLALEVALWGGTVETMPFPTPPPAPALAEARALLRALGALDQGGAITAHGRVLAGLPTHPRLGHMLILAGEHRSRDLAADLAALLAARDPLRGAGGPAEVDLAIRLQALRDPGAAEREHPVTVDRGAIAAIRAEARRLRAGGAKGAGEPLGAGALLSLAYPDRIAKRRDGEAPRYLLSGGKGAVLPPGDPLARAPFLVIADLDGDPREAKARRALSLSEAEIRALHADASRRERVCEWSRRDRAVLARDRLMLGALALEDRPWTNAPPEAVAAALVEGVRDLGLDTLPWTPAARRLAARVEWLRARGVDLPDMSDAGLRDGLDEWLAPFLTGRARLEDLARIDLAGALGARLDWEARARLDALAPAEIAAPTGTRLAIDYSGAAPSVAVRLQEMFGLTRHPSIGPDAVPLVLELLSPAGRPVQTTADLPGFWKSSYADVRRDLRGRYPKHPWPEDPAAAEPTRRAKPRG
ncbi:ATP-dependent helicase HrpB [Amaricoccus solimangrovi]|uniref:ATP-dependent helicase HrpB n=1 Tax=Amaricoccus solimangrovi TaxID=2589815 RepID=UPI003F66332B